MTGAMFIAECLKREGVEKVFGQCGHTNYALIDACRRVGIDYVSFRHEQMAAHAADAYFRVSHKLAVVNVHLSPGLTNAITGVASAAADNTPMVVFAGNTPTYNNAREPHQGIRFHADASQGDLYRPFCKRVWRVDDAKLLSDIIPRALNVAQTGRPGPVLVDVPMDIFAASIAAPPAVAGRRPEFTRAGAPRDGVERAAALLAGAQRPLIYAGNGVLLSEAAAELRRLAELTGIPVASTLVAKGVLPEDHPLALGTTGIWGTRTANEIARQADVILAVGTTFGEADCSSWNPAFTFSIPPSRLVQIDCDPQEIGKIYPAEIGLVGDARATLRELIACIPAPVARPRYLAEVDQRRQAWQQELAASQSDGTRPIHPARLLAELAKVAPRDAIFVTDVGWNKNGAGQQLPCLTPGAFLTSGGLATMGFAPPAAIGAKLGAPERPVICLVGDGGLLSVIGALTTAVEYDAPVVWVVFNNFCYSTIRTVGTTYFQSAYATEFTTPEGEPYNPDFQLLAQAFKIEGARVDDPDRLGAALQRALASGRPYLLEVVTKGDIPMPRTGYWDIASFLKWGNEDEASAASPAEDAARKPEPEPVRAAKAKLAAR